MKRKTVVLVGGACVVLIIGVLIGLGLGRSGAAARAGGKDSGNLTHEHTGTIWTCAMHPQIRLPKPGKCPICFMDLIPLTESSDAGADEAPNRIALSPLARKLAAIATVPAVRRGLSSEIRLPGKIAVDETRQEIISSRFPGRIDRLYVNATGITVRKGDHLAEIYSPELINAQQELLGAAEAVSSSAADAGKKTAMQKNLEASKEKLRLLGFSGDDIEAVLSKKTPSDHMTIRSQQGGVVLEKMAVEGTYIEAGMPLYKIADLRTIWVLLDAYESDLAWVRPGQKVEFTVETWPGELFSGIVHFIDPVIDPMMRTAKVRVEAPNSAKKLKPEMLVRAVVRAGVSASGKVSGQNLRGKWMCPMHPNIIKSGPGSCDICGMPLETAESLGYATSGLERIDPLVIPATAPLITGERAVVYVQADSSELVVYEGKEITLGPRVGDYYVVKSGLTEGEKVVVNGAFQIDSELQIRAKKSMMNPQGGGPAQAGHAGHAGNVSSMAAQQPVAASKSARGNVSASFIKELDPLYSAYFRVADALSNDDLAAAKKSLEQLSAALSKIKQQKSGDAIWQSIGDGLKTSLVHTQHIMALADARTIFAKAGGQVIRAAKKYGNSANETWYLTFCPMAFDGNGAYWLQKKTDIVNPYFGPSMLKCGEIKEKIGPVSMEKDSAHVHN